MDAFSFHMQVLTRQCLFT